MIYIDNVAQFNENAFDSFGSILGGFLLCYLFISLIVKVNKDDEHMEQFKCEFTKAIYE